LAEKSTAATVTLDVPLSFSVTIRSALFVLSSRLMPLNPESPASGGELGLGRRDQVGGLLQLKQVGPDARRQNNFAAHRIPREIGRRSTKPKPWGKNILLRLIFG
jgi:hypothetical protein